ncbi:hypothetical protein [Leucobacter celer]|uniref:hypothetical protein n=1 Tax=Leucobacter celer TaxID=668625 RepID=UPI0006A77E2B|nr:hypothetical protein [Leucobacter celer]
MGRIQRREIVGIRCEVRTCRAQDTLSSALPYGASWHDQVSQLEGLVAAGWSLVLTQQIRSYCPVHAARARECTCRTHPTRRHLCVVHTGEVVALVWDQAQTPVEVTDFLKVVS